MRSDLPQPIEEVVGLDEHWSIYCQRHSSNETRRHALAAGVAHFIFAGAQWRACAHGAQHKIARFFADELLVPLQLLDEERAIHRRPSAGVETFLDMSEILAATFRVELPILLRRLELLVPSP